MHRREYNPRYSFSEPRPNPDWHPGGGMRIGGRYRPGSGRFHAHRGSGYRHGGGRRYDGEYYPGGGYYPQANPAVAGIQIGDKVMPASRFHARRCPFVRGRVVDLKHKKYGDLARVETEDGRIVTVTLDTIKRCGMRTRSNPRRVRRNWVPSHWNECESCGNRCYPHERLCVYCEQAEFDRLPGHMTELKRCPKCDRFACLGGRHCKPRPRGSGPGPYLENPYASRAKAKELARLVESKPGIRKIARRTYSHGTVPREVECELEPLGPSMLLGSRRYGRTKGGMVDSYAKEFDFPAPNEEERKFVVCKGANEIEAVADALPPGRGFKKRLESALSTKRFQGKLPVQKRIDRIMKGGMLTQRQTTAFLKSTDADRLYELAELKRRVDRVFYPSMRKLLMHEEVSEKLRPAPARKKRSTKKKAGKKVSKKKVAAAKKKAKKKTTKKRRRRGA